MRPRRQPRKGGFTLIEVLAVVLMTSLVLTVTIRFYFQLANASTAAAELTRDGRRATGLVDRVARDLESAVLVVKPPDVDPLAHPWLFLAEGRGGGEGADRIKFATLSHRPRTSEAHESDLQVVAYWLRPGEEEGFELMRWSAPTLPDQLDRSFPRAEDEASRLLADRLASFSVRLMDEEGGWADAWDSSTVVESSELPVAAEISVALLSAETEEGFADPRIYTRRVVLPIRPLDLSLLVGEEDEDEEEDEDDPDCVTVGQCIAENPEIFEFYLASRPDREELEAVVESIRDQCFSEHATTLNVQVEGCE